MVETMCVMKALSGLSSDDHPLQLTKDIETNLQWIDSQKTWAQQLTVDMASINSGTANIEGVTKVQSDLVNCYADLGVNSTILDGLPEESMSPTGQVQLTERAGVLQIEKRPESNFQLLLVGHADTVFPKDHSFQKVNVADDGLIYGPGVADMKGGLVAMLLALKAWERTGNKSQFGWKVLVNGDEETGSKASSKILVDAAKHADVGMVYEPALSDGTMAGARKGSGIYTLHVKGIEAHAGREFAKGRNAITLLCQMLVDVEAINQSHPNAVVNLGIIQGGTALNAVAANASCKINIRIANKIDQQQIEQIIVKIVADANAQNGYQVSFHGGFHRPVKDFNQQNLLLAKWLQQSGELLGQAISFVATGGCCDGNNLAAAGLPNIDTLGVRGAHIHTDKEYMVASSLVERAQLSYLFLEQIAMHKALFLKQKNKEVK